MNASSLRRPMTDAQAPKEPMILVDDDPFLAEAVRRIVMAYHPLAVYRFPPQRAEIDPGEYDLMVLVPDDVPTEMKIPTMAYATTLGLGLKGEIFVSTHRMFELRLRVEQSIPSVVQREGKLLYTHPKA